VAFASRLENNGIQSAAPLIRAGRVAREVCTIELDGATLAGAIDVPADQPDPNVLTIEADFQCWRRGVETKIIAGETAPGPDVTRIRALRNARAWSGQLRSGISLARLAESENLS